jgi:cystathionine beta-lyase
MLFFAHPLLQDPYGGSGAPLWQTATFAQPSATTFGPYDYTRSGNPTRYVMDEIGHVHQAC